MAVSNVFSVTVSSSAPSWASALSLNTWTALSNTNTFDSVKHASNATAVFTAWCGASLATGFGTHGSMIHWGGGHTDYYGNEVYRLDLSTLTWSKLNTPSIYAVGGTIPDGIYPDGTPGVPHTYHFVDYLASSNSFITTRRETTNQGGGGSYKISRFNLDTLTWTNSTVSNGLSGFVGGEGFVWDSARNGWWLISMTGGLGWTFYNPSADTWTAYTAPTGAFNEGPASYIASKDCVIFFNGSNTNIYGLDPASPSTDKVTLNVTGTSPSRGKADSPQWSSNLGALVYYPSGGNSIYLLTPPSGDWRTGTWTWSQRSVTGTTGTHTGPTGGTYSKFRVAQWGSLVVGILNVNTGGATMAVRLA